jgi:hypothetical protein
MIHFLYIYIDERLPKSDIRKLCEYIYRLILSFAQE